MAKNLSRKILEAHLAKPSEIPGIIRRSIRDISGSQLRELRRC